MTEGSRLGGTLALLAAACLTTLLPLGGAAGEPAPGGAGAVTAEQAMARLKAGNKRFVENRPKPHDLAVKRKEVVERQRPYAIVLSCSDSRVPPELVFDETVGQLFVVRVAGNVVDPVVLGSIEYGAEVLGCRLLLVLGHESCGAVKAAMDAKPQPPNISSLVQRIAPAAVAVRSRGLSGETALNQAVQANVRLQLEDALKQSKILADREKERDLVIAGGVYDLPTGQVEFLAREGR